MPGRRRRTGAGGGVVGGREERVLGVLVWGKRVSVVSRGWSGECGFRDVGEGN